MIVDRRRFSAAMAAGAVASLIATDGVAAAPLSAVEKNGDRKVVVERFSIISSKPFDTVLAALKSALGQPDLGDYVKATRAATSIPDLERAVESRLGRSGLMLFAQYDQGFFVRLASGGDAPRIVRLVVGNPLTMIEMVKRVPDAASYTPTTILVDERPDGVHVSYDRMESNLLPYGNSEALAVARDLDTKIVALVRECTS
jgi:hypothetical protein